MQQPFYCLLFKGGHLDNGVRNALYLTACRMLRKKKVRLNFKDELAEGTVSTEGKRGFLGSAVSGIKFTATIDCKQGQSITCEFLIDDRNFATEDEVYSESNWVPVGITQRIEFSDSDED